MALDIIGWKEETNEVLSGQLDLPPGFEHWLLKFDLLGDSSGFGRIEYAHYLMTREADIAMSECRLFEEGGAPTS